MAVTATAMAICVLAAVLDLPGLHGTAFGQRVATGVARMSMSAAASITDRLLPVGDEHEQRPRPGSGPKPAKPGVARYLDFPQIARAEARRAGIRRPELFARQIAAESGFDPCVRSPAGALGIAQIMPYTAKDWNVDPFDPEMALRVAAQRMAGYERKYGSYALALAAYNAGPGAVRRYRGIPPYRETRDYVRRITRTSYRLGGLKTRYRIAADIDPRFERRLHQLRAAVRAGGGGLRVNEGWRSYEDQRRLWRAARKKHGIEGARRWVAPPGCSNHNRGTAADVEGSLRQAHRLAPRHGLVFPMAHEPWHVELAGIQTQSG